MRWILGTVALPTRWNDVGNPITPASTYGGHVVWFRHHGGLKAVGASPTKLLQPVQPLFDGEVDGTGFPCASAGVVGAAVLEVAFVVGLSPRGVHHTSAFSIGRVRVPPLEASLLVGAVGFLVVAFAGFAPIGQAILRPVPLVEGLGRLGLLAVLAALHRD